MYRNTSQTQLSRKNDVSLIVAVYTLCILVIVVGFVVWLDVALTLFSNSYRAHSFLFGIEISFAAFMWTLLMWVIPIICHKYVRKVVRSIRDMY